MADDPQTTQDAAFGFSVAGFILGATMLQAAVRRGAITAEDAQDYFGCPEFTWRFFPRPLSGRWFRRTGIAERRGNDRAGGN